MNNAKKMANALKMPPDSSRALTIYQSAQKTEAQINTIKRGTHLNGIIW